MVRFTEASGWSFSQPSYPDIVSHTILSPPVIIQNGAVLLDMELLPLNLNYFTTQLLFHEYFSDYKMEKENSKGLGVGSWEFKYSHGRSSVLFM